MQKLYLDTVNDLKAQLLIVPEIVDKIQNKENGSIVFFLNWIRSTEEILKKFGYAECAVLAGLRGKLLTPEFIEDRRSSRKKDQFRVASEIVFDCQNTILRLIEPMSAKIDEARNIITQILLVLKPAGIIDYDPSLDFNNFIQGLWLMLKTNDQVGGGISKILALVGSSDAIRILADEIDLEKHS